MRFPARRGENLIKHVNDLMIGYIGSVGLPFPQLALALAMDNIIRIVSLWVLLPLLLAMAG